MQSRATATGIRSWGTEEHAVDGQADQAVGLGELASLVAAVQSHHGTWCLEGLERACRADLLDGYRGGRPSCSIPTRHIQREHPTAVRLGHRHQPVIGPGGHQVMLGLASHRMPLTRARRAGGRPWSWPMAAIDHPQRAIRCWREGLHEQPP